MSTTAEWRARWDAAMIGNYGTPPIAIVRGQGMQVTDADGHTYVDMLAGIAVNSLGHTHPAVTRAIAEQAARLIHTSNLAVHPLGVELAERLIALTGWEALAFFAQDGATANEAALKIARRHGYGLAPDGSKQRVVAMQGGFHGRTMGALAVTGNPSKRDPFGPFGHEVTFVDFGNLEQLAAAMGDDVVAVMLEPVQGENGVVTAPPGFLQSARSLATEYRALLIVDEVQSGMGRTGEWFASTAAGITPDIMTLAKGIAGGMPLGAVLVTGPARTALRPGDHGTTFGGNPVSCAAALAVIDVIEREHLLQNVRDMGARLRESIMALASPHVLAVRGTGLWLGIVLDASIASEIETTMRSRGFLINAVKPDVIRLAPPFIISGADIDAFVSALGESLREVA